MTHPNGSLCKPDATMLSSDLLTLCKGFIEVLFHISSAPCVCAVLVNCLTHLAIIGRSSGSGSCQEGKLSQVWCVCFRFSGKNMYHGYRNLHGLYLSLVGRHCRAHPTQLHRSVFNLYIAPSISLQNTAEARQHPQTLWLQNATHVCKSVVEVLDMNLAVAHSTAIWLRMCQCE